MKLINNTLEEAAIHLGYDDERAEMNVEFLAKQYAKRLEKEELKRWMVEKKMERIPPTVKVNWKAILSDNFVFMKSWSENKVEVQRIIWKGMRETQRSDGFYVFSRVDLEGHRLTINSAAKRFRSMPKKDGRSGCVWINSGSAKRYVAGQIQEHIYKHATESTIPELTEPLSASEKESGMKQPFERCYALVSSFILGKNVHDPGQEGEMFPVMHFALRRRMDTVTKYVLTSSGELKENEGIIGEDDKILTHYEWEQLVASGKIDNDLCRSVHEYDYHEDDVSYRNMEPWEMDDVESMCLSMAYAVKSINDDTSLLEQLTDRECPTWEPSEEQTMDIIHYLADTYGYISPAQLALAYGDLDTARQEMCS